MYTITDYLQYYKNTNVNEVRWNTQDNLLCAILVYLPLKSFKGPIGFDEFVDRALAQRAKKNTNSVSPKAYEMIDIIKDSARYKNLKIYDFTIRKDNETQFGAVTFRIDKETIVAFMGTDNSRIGWFENFRLSYEYPTLTQKLAIDYLKNNIKIFENINLYVVGHSKGGNLAMASAMELSNFNFRKLKKVYNFDGPGFRKEEFESEKYKRLSKKLVNIVPATAVVGTLLNNENYTVVKSNGVGFSHLPTTWSVFGEFFESGKLSGLSHELHESSTTGLESASMETRREAFEAIFTSFEGEHSKDFNFSFNNIIKVLKNIKNLDPQVSKSIGEIVEIIIKDQMSVKK